MRQLYRNLRIGKRAHARTRARSLVLWASRGPLVGFGLGTMVRTPAEDRTACRRDLVQPPHGQAPRLCVELLRVLPGGLGDVAQRGGEGIQRRLALGLRRL